MVVQSDSLIEDFKAQMYSYSPRHLILYHPEVTPVADSEKAGTESWDEVITKVLLCT
jgi:hypothetical protein